MGKWRVHATLALAPRAGVRPHKGGTIKVEP